MTAPTTSAVRGWFNQGADLALEATVAGSFSRVGYQVRRRLFAWPDQLPDLTDQVVLVTGATSGLGRATAARLASRGATVVVTGRDAGRTRAVRGELIEATGNRRIHDLVADLARLDDVIGLADQVRADHPRLDALIHNAGALVHDYTVTVDGLELTVATHVVAPFVLTRRLLGLLAATDGARVVTVTSGGMYTQALADLDLGPDGFDGVAAYAKAKRAQVVLNHQWAQRTTGQGIAFHVMHPGWVDTPGLAASLPRFHQLMGGWLRTPDQGADTITWLASQPGLEGDHLWLDRHHRWADKVPWTVTGDQAAERLWAWVIDRADPVGDHRENSSDTQVGPG
jgi:dehydrogenase/reductase SDR family member 12